MYFSRLFVVPALEFVYDYSLNLNDLVTFLHVTTLWIRFNGMRTF